MTNPNQVKLQNYSLAIRQQMAFPLHHTADQSVKFGASGVLDILGAMQMAAIIDEMNQDLVYCGWRCVQDAEPAEIAVGYREEMLVDWVSGCELWAADQDAPLIIANERNQEHFVRGVRGMLERRQGLPCRNLRPGKQIARRRVRRAAAEMPQALMENNRWVPHGESWADHRPPQDQSVVRFG